MYKLKFLLKGENMEYLVTAPIKDNIYYIGTNDRQTEKFEGMWPLPNGVAYNSFLIKGEKNIIVDLVKINTISVYIEKIKEILGDEKVDYIIMNHLEPDHSSSVPELIDLYPDVEIIVSPKAVPMLKNFYGVTENVRVVKDGEHLKLGDREFDFYLTPMVHWPESMVTYEKATILMCLMTGKQVIQRVMLNGLGIFRSILSIEKKLQKGFMLLLRRFLNIKLKHHYKGLFKF